MPEAYQVIALKYRPQTFEELVGQDHVTRTLRNAISQGRIANAYLFVGPRGTGKTTTARIFAKALNCRSSDKPTPTPCGKCDSCREIAEGNSMSVLEIDGASNNSVDQVRELRESAQYLPAGVRYKVYIIDEVHMLSAGAFNALLKTLEEPPAHVKFVFATTEAHKLLPTIISRCQRFDLRRIPQDLIIRHLEGIAKAEKINVSKPALSAIARGAEGGMRDAESALDQLIAFCGEQVGEEDVLSIFGLVSADELHAMVEALLRGEARTVIEKLGVIVEQGKDLVRLLTELLETLRNILVMQSGVELPEVDAEERQWIEQAGRLIDGPRLLRIIDIMAEAEGQMRYALSKKIFFEIALIKAVQTLSEVSLDEVIKRLNAVQGGGGPTPEPSPRNRAVSKPPEEPPARPAGQTVSKPAAASPPAGPLKSDPKLDQTWNDVLERVEKVSKMATSLLSKGRLVSVASEEVVIGFDPEFAVERASIENSKHQTLLHTKLKEVLGRDVNLRIVSADDPKIPQPHSAPAQSDDVAASRKKFEDDPLIQKAMEVFKSQILEVRK